MARPENHASIFGQRPRDLGQRHLGRRLATASRPEPWDHVATSIASPWSNSAMLRCGTERGLVGAEGWARRGGNQSWWCLLQDCSHLLPFIVIRSARQKDDVRITVAPA